MKCDLCGGTVERGECVECGKKFTNEPQTATKADELAKTLQKGKKPAAVNTQRNENFLKTTWFCILMLLILPPIGLVLMWAYHHFTKEVRIIITIFLGVSLVGNMFGGV